MSSPGKILLSLFVTLLPQLHAELGEVNVAQSKPTFGDTSFNAPTSRGNDGIDGMTNPNNWTHADFPTSAVPYPGEVNPAPNPYWQVDLEGSFDLTRLELVDRVGCCDPSRINGSTITLFDENGVTIGTPILVDGFVPSSPPESATMEFDNGGAGWLGVAAIRIDGASTNQYFQFSEFRAFSLQRVNLALGATAQFYDAAGQAVSNWGSLPISNTTDGVSTSLSHPLDEFSQNYYLEIDMGEEKTVTTVAVTGRVNCCPDRLEDARLELLDAGRNVVFTTTMAGQVTTKQEFEVPGTVDAQFARIVNANGANYGPQVAEIEIFGPTAQGEIEVTVDSVDPVTGAVSLSFTSSSGQSYAVFSSSTLEEGSWAGVIDNVQSQGDTTTISFTDSFAIGLARRFYRVEIE